MFSFDTILIIWEFVSTLLYAFEWEVHEPGFTDFYYVTTLTLQVPPLMFYMIWYIFGGFKHPCGTIPVNSNSPAQYQVSYLVNGVYTAGKILSFNY